ncbi:MAG: histone deacetylase family protein [Ilumatobacter sp.]|jgi:acetoin utilization deacetylase AcuC-like enzyme|uniref:histone deacetylase family protein n=1 Tax=Ilumatobacter sp. TaxID=1967498 RepID=UPI00391B7550
MIVYSSPRQRGHDPVAEIESSGFQSPWEHPGRADAIHRVLASDDRFDIREPREWGARPIEAVHDPALVRFLARAWHDYQVHHPGTHDVVPDVFVKPGLLDGIDDAARIESIKHVDIQLGRWCFETTTPLTEGTYDAARSAVDVALSTVDAVLGGESLAYGLCRPPGHHAPTGLYGGYCFFNNAAIAAHHVASTTGSKVTVIDVDYHHGNGTQQITYRRPDIQYVSLHGDPDRAYPYLTGRKDETGAGLGRGTNLNVPLPAKTDDDAYATSLGLAIEAIDAFDPALVIVSLGVDTYGSDPISDLSVTTDGFARQGADIAELGRPLAVVQEGGYDLETLGQNVRSFLVGAASVTN